MRNKSLVSFGLLAVAILCVNIFAERNRSLASGLLSEYDANEFALTSGGTTGVWNYGYPAKGASNIFIAFPIRGR